MSDFAGKRSQVPGTGTATRGGPAHTVGKRTLVEQEYAAVQRRTGEAGAGAAGAGTPERAPSAGGEPLPSGVQGRLERSFGAPLGDVRIHANSDAAGMNALAYTRGNDIHFAPGAYDPSSQPGLELLGHEVTHVLQQCGGPSSGAQAKTAGGGAINADPNLEAEADALGARAARGEPTGTPTTADRPGVQRKVSVAAGQETSDINPAEELAVKGGLLAGHTVPLINGQPAYDYSRMSVAIDRPKLTEGFEDGKHFVKIEEPGNNIGSYKIRMPKEGEWKSVLSGDKLQELAQDTKHVKQTDREKLSKVKSVDLVVRAANPEQLRTTTLEHERVHGELFKANFLAEFGPWDEKVEQAKGRTFTGSSKKLANAHMAGAELGWEARAAVLDQTMVRANRAYHDDPAGREPAIQSVTVSEDGTQVEILLTDPVALEDILKYKELALMAILKRTK